MLPVQYYMWPGTDMLQATMQAHKEGIDPKYRKASYYSMILANQLDGERKVKVARVANKIDQGIHIQLILAHRQMKDAYDHPPKPTVRNALQSLLLVVDPQSGRSDSGCEHE
jgi:hypothetical protein